MRGVAFWAGASVLGAYVIGSIPVGFLLTRRRLARDLRRVEREVPPGQELRPLVTGRARAAGRAGPVVSDLVEAVLDTAKVLLSATLAWHVVLAVSPGGSATRPNVGAIGFLADQVLTAWQSTALWAGVAAVVGHLAPPWFSLRARHGHAPAIGLALVYAPMGVSLGALAFAVALGATRSPASAVLAGLAVFVLHGWLAWIFDWQVGWGVTNGPELALWGAVLGGVVAAGTRAGTRTRSGGQ
jgi:glycerol-3-phosphate acyltransferase PlsY